MDKIKKNFGFGCMRFPMIGEEVDEKQVCQMVDYFLEQGFNYFDTARGYLSGKSELAIKNCLTSRHPRESYILTDKLTGNFFEKEEDIRKGIGDVMGGKVLELESERLKAEGEARLGTLINRLIQDQRTEEIQIVSTDPEKREQLYKEYGI